MSERNRQENVSIDIMRRLRMHYVSFIDGSPRYFTEPDFSLGGNDMHASNVRSLTWLLSACCSTILLVSCAPHAASNAESNQTGGIVSSPVVVHTALTT